MSEIIPNIDPGRNRGEFDSRVWMNSLAVLEFYDTMHQRNLPRKILIVGREHIVYTDLSAQDSLYFLSPDPNDSVRNLISTVIDGGGIDADRFTILVEDPRRWDSMLEDLDEIEERRWELRVLGTGTIDLYVIDSFEVYEHFV